ncbi:MAG: hypothetical protein V4596_03355 [Bdellovibrionota bacterium]
MYNKRKEMRAQPIFKTLLIILVIAVCFVFAYIKDATAASYGDLGGKLNGKSWIMASVVLKKNIVEDLEVLVLEFRDKNIADSELCKDDMDPNKLLVQIPVNIQNNLKMPNYEEIVIRMNGNNDMNIMSGIPKVQLDMKDLNFVGRAFVGGVLELKSDKFATDLVGKFAARVCN